MNDQLTLADQYLLMGLKLKDDGRVRCMFCHVYATPLTGEERGVKVKHRPDCFAAIAFNAPEASDGE
jgi:hypothetical protein